MRAVGLSQPGLGLGSDRGTDISRRYESVRTATVRLCATLEPEDCVVQTMPDVSPTKWHLAHTTWFFEEFILRRHVPGYRVFHDRYGYLFNSYYVSVGPMHRRPTRGWLSRPTVREIYAYRAYVDEHMVRLLERGAGEDQGQVEQLTRLGTHHEQQHQELILTDIKHVLGHNPLYPALRDIAAPAPGPSPAPVAFVSQRPGVVEMGFEGQGFAFDNETPRHETILAPHALASRPVTNADYLEFIEDGGYRTASCWLSDGWATVQQEQWTAPMYWSEDHRHHYTLGGYRPIDPAAPVVHVSYYEADAFARWAGARLPTEAELEHVAQAQPVRGNFVESGHLHPTPVRSGPVDREALDPVSPKAPEDRKLQTIQKVYGDVWEWTQSSYGPYPGFRPLAGSLGEYNGKFMCSQFVLRGGSCATPTDHIRPSYRNFFYPHSRWQFSGIRLARDGE